MIDLSNIPGSRPDEQTIFFLRRHWFVMIPVILGFLVVLILPVAVYYIIRAQIPGYFDTDANFTLYVLGASMFFLYAWLFLFQNFIDWYLDIWIVTNYRIINIEQVGLFGRTMSELMLYNVQDVTSEINGFIRTIFDYGVIHIQTAGETKRFEFEEIAHPNHVAKRVLELAHVRRIEHMRQGNMEIGPAA
ncbi:PH domain-containing protein [Candidatus Uhrbacteria bacterium]|nr:PH domain-containing protein [Candidatus Uhrbacteria bacterium]